MTTRLLRALRRCGRPPRLVDCRRCGRDFVNPVAWLEFGEDRWWIRVRCGECGSAREVVITNEEARQFDIDLDRGVSEIRQSLAHVSGDGSAAATGRKTSRYRGAKRT